ncbi:zinc knuckle CX2CX4HX4C containing protein [Tanacetum coccineum]
MMWIHLDSLASVYAPSFVMVIDVLIACSMVFPFEFFPRKFCKVGVPSLLFCMDGSGLSRLKSFGLALLELVDGDGSVEFGWSQESSIYSHEQKYLELQERPQLLISTIDSKPPQYESSLALGLSATSYPPIEMLGIAKLSFHLHHCLRHVSGGRLLEGRGLTVNGFNGNMFKWVWAFGLSNGPRLSGLDLKVKAGKGNGSAKEMEGLEVGGEESEGDSVSERDAQMDLENEIVSDLCKSNPRSNNISEASGSGLGNINELGPMPVPVEENPILRPRISLETDKWPKVGSVSKNGSGAFNDEEIRDGSGRKKPGSFISAVQGMSQSGNNKLKCIPARVNELGIEVVDMDPVIDGGSKAWVMTLVGYFVGLKMSHREILGHLRRIYGIAVLWHVTNGLVDVQAFFLGKGDSTLLIYFTVVFPLTQKKKSYEGMQFVLENGPWLVDGKPLFVQKWEAGLCMVKPKPSKVPLWVKIMNVPLEAWNVEGISRITSRIGNPIIMDRITTSMCEKAYGRASFARVLVEVEAAKSLVDNVEVCYKGLGRSMELRVEYPWKPLICSHYKVFGHNYDKCSSRVLSDAEKIQRVEVRSHNVSGGANNNGGEWQTVNNRRYTRNGNESGNVGFNRQRYNFGKGSSRGGFGGRGRGGFGGRGFGDQRVYKNDNFRFVHVRKNSKVVNDSGNANGKKNDSKNEMDVDTNGSGVNDTDGMNSGNLDDGRKNVKKKFSNKNEGGSNNMFSVLTDDFDVEREIDCDALMTRIDEACEKNLHISIQEREKWPKEVMDYYCIKMQELVKKSSVDDLRLKITKFERQIAHSSNMVAIESSNKAKSMVKSVMIEHKLTQNQAYGKIYDQHELDTWPGEKIEFYKSSIGDAAYKKIL